jgi:hypothetical protein
MATRRKRPVPVSDKRPTRAEVLKGAGWEPLPVGILPEKLRKAEDRRMQDYIVAWTLGLWDHVHRLDKPRKTAKGGKRTNRTSQ